MVGDENRQGGKGRDKLYLQNCVTENNNKKYKKVNVSSTIPGHHYLPIELFFQSYFCTIWKTNYIS